MCYIAEHNLKCMLLAFHIICSVNAVSELKKEVFVHQAIVSSSLILYFSSHRYKVLIHVESPQITLVTFTSHHKAAI